jgi:hypothetical protein
MPPVLGCDDPRTLPSCCGKQGVLSLSVPKLSYGIRWSRHGVIGILLAQSIADCAPHYHAHVTSWLCCAVAKRYKKSTLSLCVSDGMHPNGTRFSSGAIVTLPAWRRCLRCPPSKINAAMARTVPSHWLCRWAAGHLHRGVSSRYPWGSALGRHGLAYDSSGTTHR